MRKTTRQLDQVEDDQLSGKPSVRRARVGPLRRLPQQNRVAMVNECNSRSLFALTVMAVLAPPIDILTGLFGMNVGGVPPAQNEQGFWVAAAAVASFIAVAGWLAFQSNSRSAGRSP